MNRTALKSVALLTGLIVAGLSLTSSAQAPAENAVQRGNRTSVFSDDKAELPKAKPWTAKKSKDYATIGVKLRGAICAECCTRFGVEVN